MNICLIRQDESADEVNLALGEIILGRGPLLGVSTIGSVQVCNVEIALSEVELIKQNLS
jgi:hypothetical protein